MPDERYRFRSPRQLGAVGMRRQQLQADLDGEREALAFGRFELEVMKLATEMQQHEEVIKQSIMKERQVSEATRAVAELDESDPSWGEKFATIMADYPRAQDNKYLQDRFSTVAKINQAHLENELATGLENLRNKNLSERQRQDNEFSSVEAKHRFMEISAAKGVDVSARQKEDGSFDWTGLKQDFNAAKSSLPDRPDEPTIRRYGEVQNNIARLRNEKEANFSIQKNENTANRIANAPWDENKWVDEKSGQLKGPELAGYEAELSTMERQFPQLAPPPTTAASANSATSPAGAVSNLPAFKTPGDASTPATAQPAATPFPSPPPEAIEILKQRPDARAFFEKRYGDATPYLPAR